MRLLLQQVCLWLIVHGVEPLFRLTAKHCPIHEHSSVQYWILPEKPCESPRKILMICQPLWSILDETSRFAYPPVKPRPSLSLTCSADTSLHTWVPLGPFPTKSFTYMPVPETIRSKWAHYPTLWEEGRERLFFGSLFFCSLFCHIITWWWRQNKRHTDVTYSTLEEKMFWIWGYLSWRWRQSRRHTDITQWTVWRI